MAQDETTRLFYEEVAEKKSAARGARHRASRTGKIGKVNLPADFLGRSYTKSSPAVSFSVDDVLCMLQETPTLKELLMQRLDAEYEHYKLAIERTIDAVARIQETALTAVLDRLQNLEEQVRRLQEPGAVQQPAHTPRRSRGKSVEEVRQHVFPRLAEALREAKMEDFKTVTAIFPGIRYYLYQLRVWPGFQEMMADFREWSGQAAGEEAPSPEPTGTAAVFPAGEEAPSA